MSTIDLRPRKILSALAAISVVGAIVLWLTACGAIIGPATKMDDSYMITCGVQKCDPTYYECSVPWYPPVHCQTKFAGASRDAGSE